jgi:hypothetical protein
MLDRAFISACERAIMRAAPSLAPDISRMFHTLFRTAAAIGLLLTCTAGASAATLYLADGSIVIGKITELVDGEDLTVDTEHMGDVVIEWDAIERIEGTAPVNVELFSGDRLAGDLRLDENGLFVNALSDRGVQEIRPEQVFKIEGYTDGLLDGLEGYVDVGVNIIRGNNQVSQVSYSGGVSFDANRFETGVDTTLIINEQDLSPDTRRFTAKGFYNQKLTRRLSVGGLYQFESDDQQELDGRSLVAINVNDRVINTRVQRVTLLGGLALNAEDFANQPATESIEALLGTVYRLRSKWGLDFDSTLYLLPSLSQSRRVRVQFDSALSTDLLSKLEVRLTYYNRFDNQPPVGVTEFDYGITLGLGYDF